LRRFDLDADAKLSKKEFKEGVAPQSSDYSKREIKEKSVIGTSRTITSPARN